MSRAGGRAWGHPESSQGWVGPGGGALVGDSVKVPHRRSSWPGSQGLISEKDSLLGPIGASGWASCVKRIPADGENESLWTTPPLPNQGQWNKVWTFRHGGLGAYENFREARIAEYTGFPYKIEWLPSLTVRLTRAGDGKETLSTASRISDIMVCPSL